MRRKLFLVLTLFISFYGIAQQSEIDSLVSVYQTQKVDTIRIKTLSKICSYYYFRKPEEGFVYADSLAELGKRTDQKSYISTGYVFRGNSLVRKGKFEEAIIEFKKGIKLQDSIGEEKYNYPSYMNIGTSYKYARDFVNAQIYYDKAIDIATRYDKKDRLIVIYNNLGSMAQSQEKFEVAVEFFMKAIESKEFNNNQKRLISPYVNLGTIHYDLNQFEKALEYSNEALKLSEKENYLVGIADSKKNIGKIFVAQDSNIEDAIENLKDAINIYTEINDDVFLLEAYSAIGQAYENVDDLDNAIKFHSKAVTLSQEIEMQDNVFGSRVALARALINKGEIKKANAELTYILNDTQNEYLLDNQLLIAYELKTEISSLNGNYKEALKYHKLFKNLNDELLSADKLKNINELETKYETEKKEKENLALKKEKAEQSELLALESKRKWQLGGSLIAAIIALGVFAFYYRRNQKQKEVIENLQKELHHRIKNNLSVIDAFIDVIKEDLNDTAFTAKLTELQMRIDSINEVHLQLYNNKDVTNLNIKKYIDSLAKNVSSSFKTPGVTINKTISENLKLDADKTFPIGLIINEFLTNSYKYAFGQSSGKINIELTDLGQKYSLNLSDNGKGLPKDFDISNTDSFGLRLMSLLTKQLNGTLQITNNNGMQLAITFPK